MKLTFLQSTGLGETVAEAGETVDILDPTRVQEFIALGRAVVAEGEDAPPPATALVTDAAKSKKGGK